MFELHQIQLPLGLLPLLVLFPGSVLTGLTVWLRRVVRSKTPADRDPDWSVPSLADEPGDSLFHGWDVRCKIVTILVCSFAVASLREPGPALAAIGLSILAVCLARPPWSRVLLRCLALTGFLGMLLLVMPLTVPDHPGDPLLVFGGLSWLDINLRGLELAAVIAAKALAIALMMEPLLSTAPLPVTLQGLSRLGVPEMFGQMLLLSHRYVHVFRQEAGRMAAAMQVRGFRPGTDLESLRALGNFLGMLFVRSFERTERVFEAMQARGYRGRFPDAAELRLRIQDLLISLIWLGAALALVLLDRVF